MSKRSQIGIIGGGAAGLIAAISAARHPADVTILERMNRVGKKILVTGNGKCNLSNVNLDISKYHGQNPFFAEIALEKFNLQRTLDFFEELGLVTKTEIDGKIFPYCEQASTVLDVLRYEIKNLGVEEICHAEIQKIIPQKKGFDIIYNDKTLYFDNVILATGGKSYPHLGSNGSGYELASSLGHRLISPFPALVQIKLTGKLPKQIQGVKIDGKICITEEEQPLRTEYGEILFTDYGISGIPALQISRIATEILNRNKKAFVRLDLLPDFSEEKLTQFITQRITTATTSLYQSFIGFLHKRLIRPILKMAAIDNQNKLCSEVTAEEIEKIVNCLKHLTLEVSGTLSWQTAQVTAGGIDTRQINPASLESKLVKGLFFAGEVMDIDGDSGGYNLQWAWSSGFVAGESAAR